MLYCNHLCRFLSVDCEYFDDRVIALFIQVLAHFGAYDKNPLKAHKLLGGMGEKNHNGDSDAK